MKMALMEFYVGALILTNGTKNVPNVTKLSVMLEYIFCQLACEFNGLKIVGGMNAKGPEIKRVER